MNETIIKALIINLATETGEVKSFDDLRAFIGGVGVGLKLAEQYSEKDPLILCVGPLNGFFPFASKTAIIMNNGGVIEDLYIGGSLSLRIRFSGINAIVILGKLKNPKIINIENDTVRFEPSETETGMLGLPGKRSVLEFGDKTLLLDNYFKTPENLLGEKFKQKNLTALVITGTKTFSPKNFDEYEELYANLLAKKGALSTLASDYPSCSNCPLGCLNSRTGELGGNVLVHSLSACKYAESLYSDIGLVFSCLNALGYDYQHEDIEKLPGLIEETLQKLS